MDLFFTYVTVAIAISLEAYIFALKNKKATHPNRVQGDAWNRPAKDDHKNQALINARRSRQLP